MCPRPARKVISASAAPIMQALSGAVNGAPNTLVLPNGHSDRFGVPYQP